MTPQYLRDNLPRQRVPLYRNISNDYHEIFCITSRYMNSFFHNVIKSWNGIGPEFQSCTSLGSFKRSILNLIRPIKHPTFGIHDPLGLKRIFQLRVSLSPLKCHKKGHNFIDTPNDWCDCHCAPESTKHFILECPLFLLQIQKLTLSVSTLLVSTQFAHLINDVKLYLYGHHSLNDIINKSIISSKIIYVTETGSFS